MQVLITYQCGSGSDFVTEIILSHPDVSSTTQRPPQGYKSGIRKHPQVHQSVICNRLHSGYQLRGGEVINTGMQDLCNIQQNEDAATDVRFKENRSNSGNCIWDRNHTSRKTLGMLNASGIVEEVIYRNNETKEIMD